MSMFYFLSGLVAVIAGYYGSLEKPYRKKMLPLILASIVLYLFGGMLNIWDKSSALLVLLMTEAFIWSGFEHIVLFYGERKIHFPFTRWRKANAAIHSENIRESS